MIYPSLRSLLEKVNNKYSLVVITSKRARQLVAGQEALVNMDSNNPVTIATNEVHEDMIEYSYNEDAEN